MDIGRFPLSRIKVHKLLHNGKLEIINKNIKGFLKNYKIWIIYADNVHTHWNVYKVQLGRIDMKYMYIVMNLV